MFSFIHIPFISLFINTWSDAAGSASKCLTFKKIKENIDSSCTTATIVPKKTICLKCTIKEINNITKNTCIKNFACVHLKFPNDSLFEYTMKNHREIIYNLFNISGTREPNMFNISLTRFDRKDINKSFIESILGNNTKPYYHLDLHILKRDINQALPYIDPNLSQVNIGQVRLHMPCNNSNKTIHYNINETGVFSKGDLVCNIFSTTLTTKKAIRITISTNHMKLSTTEIPIITQELTTINLNDVVQTKLLFENNSTTTIITTSKLFPSTAKPSRNFFLFLLPGLLVITILVALIIMYSILKNHRKPIDIINDNSSDETPELISELSDTEISSISNTSSAMISLADEFATAPNLKTRTTLSFDDGL